MIFQPTLLDVAGRPERVQLGDGAWVELSRGWLGDDADDLMIRLIDTVAWQAERRQMYGRIVEVPRLARFYGPGEAWPDPALEAVRRRLDGSYASELGETFASVGLCWYRDGRDSVAWHGDTIGRGGREDTMVAIVSLGSERKLALRPRRGGPSHAFSLAHGDLLVMGGSCQRTWEHAVLKTARPVGPRVSVQFRPHDVR